MKKKIDDHTVSASESQSLSAQKNKRKAAPLTGKDEVAVSDKDKSGTSDIRARKLDALRDKVTAVKDTESSNGRNGDQAQSPVLRSKPLGSLKITSAPSSNIDALELPDMGSTYLNDNSGIAESQNEHLESNTQESESDMPMLFAPARDLATMRRADLRNKVTYGAAVFVTWIWLVFCAAYIWSAGGQLSWSPQALGAMLAGIFAPPALLWLILANINRRADVNLYAASLRAELQSMLFPSEENARVINKDIENLCRQAAEISMASKSVLKSLQRARQGLRVEMRDFSGVSKKAEFHIDRLAGSLQERTAKLQSLTDEIEQRTQGIDQTTQAGAEAWDKAAQKVLERAGAVEVILGKGTEQLLSAADKAKEKAASIQTQLERNNAVLEASVEKAASKLDELSGNISEHHKGLDEAVMKISQQTQSLGSVIKDHVRDLEEVTQNAMDVIGRSGEVMRANKDEMEKAGDNLSYQAERISDSVMSSVLELDKVVDKIVDESSRIETRVEEKVEKLRETVSGIGDEADTIEQAGHAAAHKLGEALSLALSGAENIGSAVRRAVEALDKSAKEAESKAGSITQETVEAVSALSEAGQMSAGQLRELIALLEKSCEQIEKTSAMTGATVGQLENTVQTQEEKINLAVVSLKERVEAVKVVLEDPLQEIRTVIQDVDSRHEQIETTLSRRISDLNEASEKAVNRAETIRETLRGQAQEIATLSGQVSGNSRTITEQISQQRNSLNVQVKDTLESIELVRKSLGMQSEQLESVSVKAIAGMKGFVEQISARADDITQFTTQAFTDLQGIDQSLDGKILLLKRQADNAMESVVSVKQALENSARDIEPVYLRAIEQAEDAHSRFEKLKAGFELSTDSNLEKMHQIGILFDERLQQLKSGSDSAAEVLESSSSMLKKRVEDIEQAASSAHEKIDEVSCALKDQKTDIHLLTDQAILRVEGVQKVINEQFHELSESVGQAITQLEDVGSNFVRKSQSVNDAADSATSSLEVASEKARNEVAAYESASSKTLAHTSEMVSAMKGEADKLLEQANESLMALRKAGDSFAVRAREVAEQMKASLNVSESYGQQLRAQAALISNASAETAENLSRSISYLSDKVADVGQAANDVGVRIEKSRRNLSEESERLLMVSTETLETVNRASQTFGKQSESLFKASEDARKFAEKIAATQIRSQRDAFMSSAKFVIESLHSLSVDLTRMMKGEVSEKTWKSFQKGDVAAFTRKLVQIETEMPIEKAREKFADDSEFRTYVQRYIRQFEELFDQATENDHGALLTSTFASSEIGKLYQILCSISGKDTKFDDSLLKAS